MASAPPTLNAMKLGALYANSATKLHVIERLYEALPPEFQDTRYSDKASAVAFYNDCTHDDKKIIDWYERALVGIRLRKENA